MSISSRKEVVGENEIASIGKCLIFSKERINYNEITPILLNELPLPFVNDLKHLGNVLQIDNSLTIDCNKKRAIFISKIHSLNQEF